MRLDLGPLVLGVGLWHGITFGVTVWRQDIFPLEVTIHLGPFILYGEWRR